MSELTASHIITFSAIWCTFNLRSKKSNPDHVSKALAMSLLSELVREAKPAEFGAGAPHFKASRPPFPDQARSWSTSRPKGLMPVSVWASSPRQPGGFLCNTRSAPHVAGAWLPVAREESFWPRPAWTIKGYKGKWPIWPTASSCRSRSRFCGSALRVNMTSGLRPPCFTVNQRSISSANKI